MPELCPILLNGLKDRVCILYFFARLSVILPGIQLEICAKNRHIILLRVHALSYGCREASFKMA